MHFTAISVAKHQLARIALLATPPRFHAVVSSPATSCPTPTKRSNYNTGVLFYAFFEDPAYLLLSDQARESSELVQYSSLADHGPWTALHDTVKRWQFSPMFCLVLSTPRQYLRLDNSCQILMARFYMTTSVDIVSNSFVRLYLCFEFRRFSFIII